MEPMDAYCPNLERRCWNSENATMERSSGGRRNDGTKGSAFVSLPAGETAVLLNARGAGAVDHIWLTYKAADRPLHPELLRALRLDMYWDSTSVPAVSVPLGDFFGVLPGVVEPFENALFTFPFARALNAYIRMPFRSAARIELVNTSDTDVSHLFYTVEYRREQPDAPAPAVPMYVHASWREESPNRLGEDFDILPFVPGRGRFLGCHFGIRTNPGYGNAWWGEGEVKTWLDGDGEFPSLIGTGTEDYLGAAWCLDRFIHAFQGCPVADFKAGLFAGYRYHLPDPVWFHDGCRVAIQTLGGAPKKDLPDPDNQTARYRLVSVDQNGQLIRLFEQPEPWQPDDPRIGPDDWCNFFRQDTWCATAFYYSEHP